MTEINDEISLEDTIDDSPHDSAKSSPVKITRNSSSRRKSRSKYAILEEKMDNKLSSLDTKLNGMMNLFSEHFQRQGGATNGDRNTHMSSLSQRQNSENVESQRPTECARSSQSRSGRVNNRVVKDSDSENSDRENDNDVDSVSLNPGQDEIIGSGSDNDSDDTKSQQVNLSSKTKKCLFDIFGEDAIAKKTDKKIGLAIDNSQKEVLKGHWRTDKPSLVTAFAEESKELFPIDEETEKFLQVPTLDDLIGSCLIKRHGNKASFTKAGKNLFSQPYKMLEKIAYRGQQSSMLGIVICLYVQQALGNLIETLSDDSPDLDRAMQQVRDIFAMTTKELDQLGRTGAFHHIIRRQLCMSDTSLYLLSDSRDISDLPLTGDGVFGPDLVSTLKSRKEKDKTLEDLLPDIFPKVGRKRKSTNGNDKGTKKTKLDTDKSSEKDQSGSSNFRIPKISHTGFSGNGNKRFVKKKSDEERSTKSSDVKKSSFSTRGGKTFSK